MFRFSKFLSYLFHPLLLPTYIIFVLLQSNAYFNYRIPEQVQYILVGTIFVITFLFPFLSCLLMLKQGIIKSVEMESGQERFYPYVVTVIYFFACYFFLKQMHLSAFFYKVQLGAAVSVLITACINYKWKISAHLAGIGGAAAVFYSIDNMLSVNYFFEFILIVLLAGLLGTARLISGTHTHAQIYAGFILGFTCMFIVMSN